MTAQTTIKTAADAEAWLAEEGYTVTRQRSGEDLYYLIKRDSPACYASARTDDALIDFVRRHMPAQPAPRLVRFVWSNPAGTLREVYDADSADRFGRAFKDGRNDLRYVEQFIGDRCADQPAEVKTLNWHRNPLGGNYGDCILTFYYEGERVPVVNGWAISRVGTADAPVGWRIYDAAGKFHGMDVSKRDAVEYCYEFGANMSYREAYDAADRFDYINNQPGEPTPAPVADQAAEAFTPKYSDRELIAWLRPFVAADASRPVWRHATGGYIVGEPCGASRAGWRYIGGVGDFDATLRRTFSCEWCGHFPCLCEEDGPDRLCEPEPVALAVVADADNFPAGFAPSEPEPTAEAQPDDGEPLLFCALVGEAEDDVSDIRFMTAEELATANEEAERATAGGWRWVDTLDERQILHLTRMYLWHMRVMALAVQAELSEKPRKHPRTDRQPT